MDDIDLSLSKTLQLKTINIYYLTVFEVRNLSMAVASVLLSEGSSEENMLPKRS